MMQIVTRTTYLLRPWVYRPTSDDDCGGLVHESHPGYSPSKGHWRHFLDERGGGWWKAVNEIDAQSGLTEKRQREWRKNRGPGLRLQPPFSFRRFLASGSLPIQFRSFSILLILIFAVESVLSRNRFRLTPNLSDPGHPYFAYSSSSTSILAFFPLFSLMSIRKP